MTDKFLSQDEVNTLLEGVTGGPAECSPNSEPGNVRPYDLATEGRILRGRMPTLELVNARFSRLFRIGLGNFLRRSVVVTAGAVHLTKYSEFIRGLAAPANLNLVHIQPLRGTALFVIDQDLVFLLVDNFFGGDGRFQTRVEERDFTQTEQRVIQRILAIVFESYSKSWETVYPVQFEYLRSETNTQFASIAAPNEVVLVVSFSLELGAAGGQIHVCLPYAMIEPIKDILTRSLQGESIALDRRWEQLIKQHINDAEVEAVANFCTAPSTLRDIMNMKVGDVVPLTLPDTIELKVDQIPVMECHYGQLNGLYALCVENVIHSAGEGLEIASHDG